MNDQGFTAILKNNISFGSIKLQYFYLIRILNKQKNTKSIGDNVAKNRLK